MDRLTQHTPENFGYAEYELKLGIDEQDAIGRLADYENIGLTPEEITAMKSERDTLKKALELACGKLIELLGTNGIPQDVANSMIFYAKQAQEQEGQK